VIPVFSAPFGGPVRVVRSISKELAKGHEVTIYTTSALDHRRDFKGLPTEVELDGYRVVYFPRIFRFSGFNVSPTMARALRKTLREFDIIHLHSWRQFQDVIVHYYAKRYGVPYVLQTHGSLPRIMAKQRLKWIYDVSFGYSLLRDASKVIALSRTEAQQYRGMGVPEEKIEVIPNGIDLSEYGDLPPKGSFKKKFSIDNDEKIILYLGRIHRIKGIDILVKAFANVIEKLDDVRLVVIGPDDGYLGELEALIKTLKIRDYVLILGPLYGRDKLEAYVDADVYVLPSRYETFPMGLLEAYACGKLVVASRVGGLKDLVVDGETGLLVEPGDVKQLARSMLCLLNDDDEPEEISLKGRDIVRENFAIEKVVDRLERLYEGLF